MSNRIEEIRKRVETLYGEGRQHTDDLKTLLTELDAREQRIADLRAALVDAQVIVHHHQCPVDVDCCDDCCSITAVLAHDDEAARRSQGD